MLPIYDDATLHSYRGKNRLEMVPHVYAVAESAHYNMRSYGDNQCVIISGESGAGKTEAAKRIMQYIAAVSGEGSNAGGINDIKEMVLATNPLLESFGCAKTLRNNNSSRHVRPARSLAPSPPFLHVELTLARASSAGQVPRDRVRLAGQPGRRHHHQLPPREGASLSPSLPRARPAG